MMEFGVHLWRVKPGLMPRQGLGFGEAVVGLEWEGCCRTVAWEWKEKMMVQELDRHRAQSPKAGQR